MKYDLVFNPPWMNAAGMLGFAPQAQSPGNWKNLCLFVTNPVSLEPRTPAQWKTCLAFAGGFLLHTGYPNPGLKSVLRRYAERWSRSPIPVLVHLLAQTPVEVRAMAAQLEGLEGVAGLEVGIPPGAEAELAVALIQAAAGELPVLARLPLERSGELAPWLGRLEGVAGISLGPPRGSLPGENGKLVRGRLYGPAFFPLALEAVRLLHQTGLPVIGAGGVYRLEQGQAMLAAGAQAVQLDTVLWRGESFLPDHAAWTES